MTRTFKLSCDIDPNSLTALSEICTKYERSRGYMIDRMINKFHLEVFGKPKKAKVKRKIESVPTNFDEQFELLWWAKGRTGAKQKAKDFFYQYALEGSNEDLSLFTKNLIDDIEKKIKKEVPGFEALHLFRYIRDKCWES